MFLIGNNKDVIKELKSQLSSKFDKSQLSSKFDMKDLDAAKFILGMEIRRYRANKMISLNQRKYVETVL